MAYAKYKEGQEVFIDWVLKTSDRGKRLRGSSTITIKGIGCIVSELVEGVKAVGVAFCEQGVWKDLPEAIKAGTRAVELRKYVTAKHESADHGHKHMQTSLESWLADLRGVRDTVLGSRGSVGNKGTEASEGAEGAEGEEGPFAFHNMYAALMDSEDDNVEQEGGADLGLFESASTRTSASGLTTTASVRASANARFEEDKDFFFLCAFHDLDEMMRVVQSSWADYKAERVSLLAATIVTGAAIKMAIRIDCLMQITYPAVRIAYNFMEILGKIFKTTGKMNRIIAEAKQKTSDAELGLATTVPDFLFMELSQIVAHLQSFTTAIPQGDSLLLLREGYFGPVYGEDTNPLREVFVTAKNFLCMELPLLYNVWLATGRKTMLPELALNSGSTLSGQFLGLISEYFKTKAVSLSLAFAVLCWVKSVALTQGGGFLAKTVYLAGDSQRELQERLERCIKAGRLTRDDKKLASYVSVLCEAIKSQRAMVLLVVCR
jgi:hypothetical protein